MLARMDIILVAAIAGVLVAVIALVIGIAYFVGQRAHEDENPFYSDPSPETGISEEEWSNAMR